MNEVERHWHRHRRFSKVLVTGTGGGNIDVTVTQTAPLIFEGAVNRHRRGRHEINRICSGTGTFQSAGDRHRGRDHCLAGGTNDGGFNRRRLLTGQSISKNFQPDN